MVNVSQRDSDVLLKLHLNQDRMTIDTLYVCRLGAVSFP